MAHKSSHPIRRRVIALALAFSAVSGAAAPDDPAESLANLTNVHTVDDTHEERKHNWHPILTIRHLLHH